MVDIKPSSENWEQGLVTYMLPALYQELTLKYGTPSTTKGDIRDGMVECAWRISDTQIELSGSGKSFNEAWNGDRAFWDYALLLAGFDPNLKDKNGNTKYLTADQLKKVTKSCYTFHHNLLIRYSWRAKGVESV